jgi:hypothetical protein
MLLGPVAASPDNACNAMGEGSQTQTQARRLPNQAETVFNPTDNAEDFISRVPVAEASKGSNDLDYLTASAPRLHAACTYFRWIR